MMSTTTLVIVLQDLREIIVKQVCLWSVKESIEWQQEDSKIVLFKAQALTFNWLFIFQYYFLLFFFQI